MPSYLNLNIDETWNFCWQFNSKLFFEAQIFCDSFFFCSCHVVQYTSWPQNLDLFWGWNWICLKSCPWICSGVTAPSKSTLHVFVHICLGLDKLTGFEFTRVSFWHMLDRHKDRSDLLRSVGRLKLVSVKFRSSSDLGGLENWCLKVQIRIRSWKFGELVPQNSFTRFFRSFLFHWGRR